jgi:hypothetical protein
MPLTAQVDGRRGGHREQHEEVPDVAGDQHEDGRDHEDHHGHEPRDFAEGHAGILQIQVAEPPLTPELALDYLNELSTDIRAAAILDSSDGLAAHSGDSPERGERMRTLVLDLFETARGAVKGLDDVPGMEVSTPNGVVFAVRQNDWTIAVVSGRYALSSLMLYDLRRVAEDLG